MDNVRIWVQVKGIKNVPTSTKAAGKVAIKIRADLALRWARSADTLVLALWDVTNHVGWYSIPSLIDLGHEELVRKGRETISIQIYFQNEFNDTSANLIIWNARINHLADFVRNYLWLSQEDGQFSRETAVWAREAIVAAIIDMMINLRMINDEEHSRENLKVDPNFIKVIFKAMEERNFEPEDNQQEMLGRSMMAAILQQTQKITGNGLPTVLLTEMVLILMAIFEPEFFN